MKNEIKHLKHEAIETIYNAKEERDSARIVDDAIDVYDYAYQILHNSYCIEAGIAENCALVINRSLSKDVAEKVYCFILNFISEFSISPQLMPYVNYLVIQEANKLVKRLNSQEMDKRRDSEIVSVRRVR